MNFILQIFFFYTIFLLLTSSNLFLGLLYFFLSIFFFTFCISLVQMELFAGFLIVIEYTVIFIFLIFVFFLNSENNFFRVNLLFNYKFLYFLLFFFFFILFDFFFFFFDFSLLNNFYLMDNFFESNNNFNMNDFISIFLSYYNFNSITFIAVCLLLLIGSVICVNLNKISFFLKNMITLNNKKNIYFKNFFLFRKQNMINQANINQTIKIIKKK